MENLEEYKEMTQEEYEAERDEFFEFLYGGEDEETRREREMFGPFEDIDIDLLESTNDEMPDWGN